jgi:hypothetical protein
MAKKSFVTGMPAVGLVFRIMVSVYDIENEVTE